MSIQAIARLVFHGTLFVLVLIISGISPLQADDTLDAACVSAETLELNATLRRDWETSHRNDRFQFFIAEAGVLALHISSPDLERSQPKLAFLGMNCTGRAPRAAGYAAIREKPRELLLLIDEPGTYFLAVSSEDSAAGLPRYKLRTTFAADPGAPGDVLPLDLEPAASCGDPDLPSIVPGTRGGSRLLVFRRHVDPTKDVDPWECDVTEGSIEYPGVVTIDAEGSPLMATLYEEDDCSPGHRLAEGALGESGGVVAAAVHPGTFRLVLEPLDDLPLQYSLGVKHFALCELGERDDHGDMPLCATSLETGAGARGTIENVAGDDEDYFTFTLGVLQTVEIGIHGGGRAYGVLYDEDGQRLTSDSPCRGPEAGRILRTLGPGRYYVQVAGFGGMTAPYTVSLAVLTGP